MGRVLYGVFQRTGEVTLDDLNRQDRERFDRFKQELLSMGIGGVTVEKPDWVVQGEKAAKAGLSKDMTYYIVEIAHNESNPVHRMVAFHRHIGDLMCFSSGYTEVLQINYAELYYFRVVEELATMNEKARFKLPDACLMDGVIIKGEPCNLGDIPGLMDSMGLSSRPKKYIHAKERFETAMFLFEEGSKTEVIGEEPDAYLFVNHLGRQDQIAMTYLKLQPQLEVIEE